MDEATFHKKLEELLNQTKTLPHSERKRLKLLVEDIKNRHAELNTTLQDSLDYLRLSIKYLLFDLEATRRENEYLRKLLEGGGNKQPPPNTS